MFSGKKLVAKYVKFRPDYPFAVYEAIVSYCGITPGHQQSLAVDLACGPGNSTRPLVGRFHRVIGIDISQDQIIEARKSLTTAEFRLGQAEDLSFLGEHSVDLITCFLGLALALAEPRTTVQRSQACSPNWRGICCLWLRCTTRWMRRSKSIHQWGQLTHFRISICTKTAITPLKIT